MFLVPFFKLQQQNVSGHWSGIVEFVLFLKKNKRSVQFVNYNFFFANKQFFEFNLCTLNLRDDCIVFESFCWCMFNRIGSVGLE